MRKEIDGSELTADMAEQVPSGDMGHLVWQAAYAAAYAKIFVAGASADADAARSQWHSHVGLACEAADLAYFSYIKMGGNEVPVSKAQPKGEKKEYPEGEPYEWGVVEVARETEKALKVKPPGADDADGEWIPKSQIHSKSEVHDATDVGLLMVKQWFAEQNGKGADAAPKEEIPF